MRGTTGLQARLKPHVAGGFDRLRYGWWPREATGFGRVMTRRAIRHRRRLEAELPEAVEQLAELVDAGCGLTAATARVAWRGRGTVADELAEVAQQLRAGLMPAQVWRRWATTTGSDAAGVLASILAVEQPAAVLAQQLRLQAHELRQRAHDQRLATLSRRVRLVWLGAVVQLVAIGAVLAA